MTQATQIDGELLAKAMVERAKALETLESSKPSASNWHYLLLIAIGVVWGWFTSNSATVGHTLVAIVAGGGFFLAAGAYREAVVARRRIDALLVLTKANSAL